MKTVPNPDGFQTDRIKKYNAYAPEAAL